MIRNNEVKPTEEMFASKDVYSVRGDIFIRGLSLKPGVSLIYHCLAGIPEALAIRDAWQFRIHLPPNKVDTAEPAWKRIESPAIVSKRPSPAVFNFCASCREKRCG